MFLEYQESSRSHKEWVGDCLIGNTGTNRKTELSLTQSKCEEVVDNAAESLESSQARAPEGLLNSEDFALQIK